MTDITDQDRRLALRWCDMLGDSTLHKEAAATRRVILATVDAPAPTLAEELRSWAEDASYDEDRDNLLHAAARAEQMEQDAEERQEWSRRITEQVATLARERDEACAEVERLTAECDRLEAAQHLSDGSAWGGPVREPTVQKGAESNAESLNPADVKPGEAWRADWCGDQAVAVRTGDEAWPWTVTTFDGYGPDQVKDEAITLVARLVPAPRAITNPDELDRLAEGTIVRDKDGDAWRRTCDEWTTTADYGRFTSWAVSRSGPVTVLWEPGA